MFEKTSATSLRTNPLFATLLAGSGQAPQWNFHKYRVDRNGQSSQELCLESRARRSRLAYRAGKVLKEKAALPAGRRATSALSPCLGL
jgi:glutathione peroxidase-family protein